MEKIDRIMRSIAFYFSAALFFTLLPIVLSYALGYKIDYNDLKIYKTGIIYINSRPAGATIYVNGKENIELTPAQIEELKPGMYKLEVRREGFYPWESQLEVRPNMVTRADKIVLFPLIQDIRKVSEQEAMNFIIPDNKNFIYYMTKTGLFRSNIDGTNLKKLSSYSSWPDIVNGNRFSSDGNKFLFFNENNIYVVYLNLDKNRSKDAEYARVDNVMTAQNRIIDVFWYSGASYIIAVTDKDIKVVELRGAFDKNMLSLYKFNRPPKYVYYDEYNGSMYFIDSVKDQSGNQSNRLHRMDMRKNFFDELMKLLIIKHETEAGYEKR